jgi:hypothetical protein
MVSGATAAETTSSTETTAAMEASTTVETTAAMEPSTAAVETSTTAVLAARECRLMRKTEQEQRYCRQKKVRDRMTSHVYLPVSVSREDSGRECRL